MAHRTTRANRPLNHRIEIVPGKMSGAPCIVGTRITVAAIRALSGRGMTDARIVQFYGQQVTLEDVEAARRYNRPL